MTKWNLQHSEAEPVFANDDIEFVPALQIQMAVKQESEQKSNENS